MRVMTRVCLVLFALFVSSTVLAKEKYQHAAPIHLDHEGEKWAEKTLRKLSLEEKVGQVFMVRVRSQFLNLDSAQYHELRDTIRRYHIGSIIMTVPAEGPFLYLSQPYEAAVLLNHLQSDSALPPARGATRISSSWRGLMRGRPKAWTARSPAPRLMSTPGPIRSSHPEGPWRPCPH